MKRFMEVIEHRGWSKLMWKELADEDVRSRSALMDIEV